MTPPVTSKHQVIHHDTEGYTWTPSSLPFSATVSIIFFITSACLSQTMALFWNTGADYGNQTNRSTYIRSLLDNMEQSERMQRGRRPCVLRVPQTHDLSVHMWSPLKWAHRVSSPLRPQVTRKVFHKENYTCILCPEKVDPYLNWYNSTKTCQISLKFYTNELWNISMKIYTLLYKNKGQL